MHRGMILFASEIILSIGHLAYRDCSSLFLLKFLLRHFIKVKRRKAQHGLRNDTRENSLWTSNSTIFETMFEMLIFKTENRLYLPRRSNHFKHSIVFHG